MKSILLTLSPIVVALTLLTACSSESQKTEGLTGSRPNIILVMTDDQGMGDITALGNPLINTPNLDRFYGLSTRFTEFHVSPTCAPTRAALLSGRHEFRNGVTHTIRERERMALSTTTIAEVLRDAGYETGIFGKWHLGDEDEYQPYNRGFTETFIHGAGGIGQSFPGSCADFPPNQEKEGRYFDNAILHNDTIVSTKGFCTDVFFQGALGWIKKQHDADTPYFAFITPNAPHGPMIAPDEYKQRFLDLGYDENTAGRYGMIESIDHNFGILMDKLDTWNGWENTLVIFMTDNGQAGRSGKLNGKNVQHYTAGFKTGKGSPYEGGTHVPAFWRWQGVLKEGVDINALVAHIDLFKTFTELAGARIPAGIQPIDGTTMLPLLENAPWEDRYLFTHKGRWEKGEDPSLSKFKDCAVRTQRWRFVNNEELFDIAADPFEKLDAAADHPEVIADLRKAYDVWWEETLPFMVNEDVPYSPVHPQVERYNKQLAEQGIPEWTPDPDVL